MHNEPDGLYDRSAEFGYLVPADARVNQEPAVRP